MGVIVVVRTETTRPVKEIFEDGWSWNVTEDGVMSIHDRIGMCVGEFRQWDYARGYDNSADWKDQPTPRSYGGGVHNLEELDKLYQLRDEEDKELEKKSE